MAKVLVLIVDPTFPEHVGVLGTKALDALTGDSLTSILDALSCALYHFLGSEPAT